MQILNGLLNALAPNLLVDPIIRLEAILTVFALIASLLFRNQMERLKWVDRLLQRLSKSEMGAIIGIFACTILLHAAVSIYVPPRHPMVHDEFSYLVAADTFLHGRASNPPHALWEHFEAVHVLSYPTYSSMYPPAQGLLLAGGKLLTGSYLAGPSLATALLCALIYWMIIGWIPGRWALLGALLAVLRIGLFSYWANSFWGGTHAAIGGVLLFGLVPRVAKEPSKKHAFILAFALIILANSRPYEGLLWAACCSMLFVMRFRGTAFKNCLFHFYLLSASIFLFGVFLTALYNRQITGKWMTMAQQENYTQYGLAVLPWDSTKAERIPAVKHIREFYEDQREYFQLYRSFPGFVANRMKATGVFWAFFVGPILIPPLFYLSTVQLKKRRVQLLIAGLLFGLGLGLNPWFFPHYFSPAFGWYMLAIVLGIRAMHVRRVGSSRPFLFFARALPLIAILLAAANTWSIAQGQPGTASEFAPTWRYTSAGNTDRAEVIRRLLGIPGKHLVLVAYGPNHDPHSAWVYNDAEIDASKIVWAHDMGEEANLPLLQYYGERKIWRVRIDERPIKLEAIR